MTLSSGTSNAPARPDRRFGSAPASWRESQLLANGPELRVVGRDPKRAARLKLDMRRQLGRELIPQISRVSRQLELSFGIVHDNDMAHAGRSGASADGARFEDGNFQAVARERFGARGSDDARSDDDHIGRLTHRRIPEQKGSRGSSRSVASEVM